MEKRALAFDFGGSSGRAMLAIYDGTAIRLEEVHRFENIPVSLDGCLYWDFLRLFHEVKQGLIKAQAAGGFDTLAVDTWGVDFGLIGADGHLMENPFHYRDNRTEGMVDAVCRIIPRDRLYQETGNQIMDINTLFQLESLVKRRPDILRQAGKLLWMPALFTYFLTGVMQVDTAIASTAQMMDPRKKQWNQPLLEKLGIPTKLLPKLVPPGTIAGPLKKELCEELSLPRVSVVTGAGHDTACAVAAAPATEKEFLFISCGTWSLFGTQLDSPVLNEKSQAYNLTNEVGYGNTTRFLKNIIGLWLIQETRRQFGREGKEYSYADMEQLAKKSSPFACFIDPDAPEFVPPGDIPGRIRTFCQQSGQPIPETDGAVIRCIYESIAFKYRCALEQIEDCTGRYYDKIHILGGGAKDGFLCQLTANTTKRRIVAGPVEATALGNALVQLLASGALSSMEEGRGVIRASCTPAEYQPQPCETLETAYRCFQKNIHK